MPIENTWTFPKAEGATIPWEDALIALHTHVPKESPKLGTSASRCALECEWNL
jgi:hypothetical protein